MKLVNLCEFACIFHKEKLKSHIPCRLLGVDPSPNSCGGLSLRKLDLSGWDFHHPLYRNGGSFIWREMVDSATACHIMTFYFYGINSILEKLKLGEELSVMEWAKVREDLYIDVTPEEENVYVDTIIRKNVFSADGLEKFMIDELPKSMQKYALAMNEYVIDGIGSFVNILFMHTNRTLFDSTLDGSRLDKYYMKLMSIV
ncbi:hypothetical protein LWI29_023930 [Acer saccharum]|uniref:Uncharacterized protein n=1 Tax=Acer saccharum TaxID=4024 RepID=A0AA39S653_ACESA|nr:hypothetical protein LWI29_023930 [Acer saccharum]